MVKDATFGERHTRHDWLTTRMRRHFPRLSGSACIWRLPCLSIAHAETFVSGVVRDHLTGMPVSGAAIALVCNGIPISSTTSGADGSYAVEPYVRSPGSTFVVYTTADGYLEALDAFDATSANAHVDVALTETATNSGTVHLPGAVRVVRVHQRGRLLFEQCIPRRDISRGSHPIRLAIRVRRLSRSPLPRRRRAPVFGRPYSADPANG